MPTKGTCVWENKIIKDKFVTYDFERLMDDATLVSCSGFAKEMIKRM